MENRGLTKRTFKARVENKITVSRKMVVKGKNKVVPNLNGPKGGSKVPQRNMRKELWNNLDVIAAEMVEPWF